MRKYTHSVDYFLRTLTENLWHQNNLVQAMGDHHAWMLYLFSCNQIDHIQDTSV